MGFVIGVRRLWWDYCGCACRLCVLYKVKGLSFMEQLDLFVPSIALAQALAEFYRGDIIRGSVGMLLTSQFISLLVFAMACIIFVSMTYQSVKQRNSAL